MWHFHIIIHSSVSLQTHPTHQKIESTALVLLIHLSVLGVLMLIMWSVVPWKWGRKDIMSGLPDGMLFLFGESRCGFHSFAMSVSSLRKIFIKQNLIQSNKAGSFGSNISKSTISWKNDFHQPGLSTANLDQYVDWPKRTLLKNDAVHHHVTPLRLRRYMCMGSMSEC